MQAWGYNCDADTLPKTRVWGSKPENVHCSSATARLRVELRRGCEESSEKTAVGSGVSFKYDPFGRRVEKISPTTTSIFAYDGDNLVETTNSSGSEVASYTQGQNIDQPLAMDRSGTVDYYEQDGLGSVTSLTNATGTVAQSYTYDSFGNTTGSSGSLTNFFRYAGREFDTETGLYFNRARYLDTTTGRFASQDPTGFDAGPNFYVYALNSPTVFNDPSGLTIDATVQPAVRQALIAQIENIFPGSSYNDGVLTIPESPNAVKQTLEAQGYQDPGPYWNPFLYWDPFAHSGGWEFRTGTQTFSFHFREQYPSSSCDTNTVIDQIHFDQVNPAVQPAQHFFFEVVPGVLLKFQLGPL